MKKYTKQTVAEVTMLSADTAVRIDVVKKRVDAFLVDLFGDRVAEAERIGSEYVHLWRAISQLSQAGGKRVRPYVMLLAYNLQQENEIDAVLPAAAAQELLHLAMLIHDDIIDRDHVRYGVKNVTGQYLDLYNELVDSIDDRLHFANSAATMAGDLLIAEAYRVLQQCSVPAVQILQAQNILSDAIFRVVGGELLDTESAFRPFETIDAMTIALQKTASYSFIGPLTMGAALAGISQKETQKLSEFGRVLGVAYQLQDDILGVFGNEGVTGKSATGDITEGKHTYLVEKFYKLASESQVQQFNRIFKNHEATAKEIEQARQLLVQSGAKQAVQDMISTLSSEAYALLDTIEMRDVSRESFMRLIKKCTERVK